MLNEDGLAADVSCLWPANSTPRQVEGCMVVLLSNLRVYQRVNLKFASDLHLTDAFSKTLSRISKALIMYERNDWNHLV